MPRRERSFQLHFGEIPAIGRVGHSRAGQAPYNKLVRHYQGVPVLYSAASLVHALIAPLYLQTK